MLHLYEDKDLELLEAVMSGTVHTGVSDSCDDATVCTTHTHTHTLHRQALCTVRLQGCS